MRLENKIKNAIFKREKLLKNTESNAFRLFNGMADGLNGIAIDLYGNFLLIRIFNEKLLDDKNFIYEIITNIKKILNFDIYGCLLKNCLKYSGENIDYSEQRKSILLEGKLPPLNYNIKHLDMNIQVDLINSLNTGIFMDMRTVRNKLVKYYSNIGSILNLFCYTGVFSVHALQNNVKFVVNIDLSKSVLNRAKKNYILNNLNIDDRDFIYGNAITWIKNFIKKKKKFDLVIFDPPTFSRNKKETFSIVNNYFDYLNEIGKLIAEGGYVLSAINTFSISEDMYYANHPQSWKNVFYCNESNDYLYIDKPYLKVGLWKIS